MANGHTFFVQQLQTLTARWPMAVHATFQYGDMPDYAFGKRQRFRDWGMWLVDDEEYTSSTTADGGGINYLVLEEDEAPPPTLTLTLTLRLSLPLPLPLPLPLTLTLTLTLTPTLTLTLTLTRSSEFGPARVWLRPGEGPGSP